MRNVIDVVFFLFYLFYLFIYLQVAWTQPGVLAVVNDRDPSCAVRVFDLNTGDNYALVPPARRKTAGLPIASMPARDADPSGCLLYTSPSPRD